MLIRKATAKNVPAMHAIRLRVHENRLSDPSVVQEIDYHAFMARDTMSWVCELDDEVAGFVMADIEKQNLWALFVAPEQEGKGIGAALHGTMLKDYFQRTEVLRLTTEPGTRAEAFYRKAGYISLGPTANGRELVFELRRR